MKISEFYESFDKGSCYLLIVDSAKSHMADAVIEESVKLPKVQEMEIDRIAFFKEMQIVYQQSDCMEDFMVEGGANNVITVFAHTPGKEVRNTKLKMEEIGTGDKLYDYVDKLNEQHSESYMPEWMM